MAPAERLGENFRFIFYMSFASRSDSIALELCEEFAKYCSEKGFKNFELVVRLSKEKINSERWSEEFIDNTIRNTPNLKKVWVCGPPPMSETFEKCLYTSKKQGQVLGHEFEIL